MQNDKLYTKKMARIHCALGPKRCKTYNEYDKEMKWALLDIAPSEHPMVARPMIEIEMNGEKVFQTFDVMKYFDKKKEAIDYSKENNIEMKILD